MEVRCRSGRPGSSLLPGERFTFCLHSSSLLGLPFRILDIKLVNPQKKNYSGDYKVGRLKESVKHNKRVWLRVRHRALEVVRSQSLRFAPLQT